MFGIGMQELAIILVIALIFIGPAKLPEVARTLAKGMRELRKASDDLRSTIMVDLDEPTRPPPRSPPPLTLPPANGAKETIAASVPSSRETDNDVATSAESPEISPAIVGSVALADGVVSRGGSVHGDDRDPMDADDHRGMGDMLSSDDIQKILDEKKRSLASAVSQAEATSKPPAEG